jgi:anti-anti-sigma regulatory factor
MQHRASNSAEVEMTVRSRTVVVEQLPEIPDMKQGRVFLRELKSCMSNDCPRIVLDCSQVRQVDRPLVHMLLCCLEEALKRNGDVKLAALAPAAKAALQLAEVDRVFQIYDSANDAVNSFRQPAVAVNGDLWSAA